MKQESRRPPWFAVGPLPWITNFVPPIRGHLSSTVKSQQHCSHLSINIYQLIKKWTNKLVVMEGQQRHPKSRVVKVDSEELWNHFITQANNQGCPVFVHFGASWCVPSIAMNSHFEELAMAYQDVLFLLVDVDEAKEVASRMEVKAMPTFVLMKDGTVLNKAVGANPEEIKKRLDGFVQSFRTIKLVD